MLTHGAATAVTTLAVDDRAAQLTVTYPASTPRMPRCSHPSTHRPPRARRDGSRRGWRALDRVPPGRWDGGVSRSPPSRLRHAGRPVGGGPVFPGSVTLRSLVIGVRRRLPRARRSEVREKRAQGARSASTHRRRPAQRGGQLLVGRRSRQSARRSIELPCDPVEIADDAALKLGGDPDTLRAQRIVGLARASNSRTRAGLGACGQQPREPASTPGRADRGTPA